MLFLYYLAEDSVFVIGILGKSRDLFYCLAIADTESTVNCLDILVGIGTAVVHDEKRKAVCDKPERVV